MEYWPISECGCCIYFQFHLNMCREELSRYMEEMGSSSPGVMSLTTYLSKPFQQIERYSSLLKELERHSEVNCCLCLLEGAGAQSLDQPVDFVYRFQGRCSEIKFSGGQNGLYVVWLPIGPVCTRH